MNDRNYVEIEIEGLRCKDVLSVRGEEAVSELFRYEVEVELLLPVPDLATVVGTHVSLWLRDAAGGERHVTGCVAEARIVARDTSQIVRGRFVIKPTVYRQRLGRDCWSKQDVTAIDVIREVLEDYPHTIRYDLQGNYPQYPYRVQYREDDWTYIARLCEEEGIYYWFDHGDGESARLLPQPRSRAGVARSKSRPLAGRRPRGSLRRHHRQPQSARRNLLPSSPRHRTRGSRHRLRKLRKHRNLRPHCQLSALAAS